MAKLGEGKRLTLGDVCQKGSSNIAQKDLVDNEGKYPIYGASGFIKNVDFYHQKKSYIAVVKDGAGIGRTMLLPANSSVIGTMQYLLPKEDVDIDVTYLYYAIDSMNLAKYYSGATIPHIYYKDYQKEPINLPCLAIQREIANVFMKIDQMIDWRNQQLQKLDELVKSRFVEMFGDPVSNPKEWDVVKIGDIATEVKYGTSLPAVEGGKYPYLRMNNMTNDGHLDLSNLKYIDVPDDEIEKCIVRKGDVLFNRTNSVELVGKTCVFDLDEEMIIAGYIIRVRLHEAMLPIVFSSYMNTVVIKQYLRKIAKGAVNQANINAKELQAIQIYLPPLDLQNQFADFVAQVDKSKLAVQKSLEQLEILKKSLMQAYFG